MSVYLVNGQRFQFNTLSENSSIRFDAELKLAENPNGSVQKQKNNLGKCKKLAEDFHREFPGDQQKWKITVSFQWSDPDSSKSRACTVTAKGEMLKHLPELVNYGDPSVSLKLGIQAEYSPYDTYSNSTQADQPAIIATDLLPVAASDETVDHGTYRQPDIEVKPMTPIRNGYARDTWSLWMTLGVDDYISLADISLPEICNTTKKILENRKFCDLEIICKDDVRLPCHKAFLCVASPVIAATLESNLKKKKDKTLDAGQMSSESVTALLQFIYAGELYPAMKCCSIAHELLEAADLYDMPELWKAIATILLEKSNGWYNNVDVALRIFSFVYKCERQESLQLKRKMIQVLATKPQERLQSQLYRELFGDPVSREMIEMTLQTSSS